MKRKSVLFFICILLLAATSCNLKAVSPQPTGIEPASLNNTPPAGLTANQTVAVLQVAYIRSGDVWVWTESGASIQLTFSMDTSNPHLSMDGSVVAFIRNGQLWAVNIDGTGERLLTDDAFLTSLAELHDSAEINDILWSQTGRRLFFNTLKVTGELGLRVPQFDLYSVDADNPTSSPTLLAPPGSGGVPYLSPDGSHLALAQPDKVIFMAIDGSAAQVQFTFTMTLTYSEWLYVPQLVWLPDSSGIRLVVSASDPLSDPAQLSTLWNVPISGSPSALVNFLAVPAFGSAPFISPDGNMVLYLSSSGDMADIHTITSAGVDTIYFTYNISSVELAGWNPDSARFMLTMPDRRHTVLSTSGSTTPLGDTPEAGDVKWLNVDRYLFMNLDELRLATFGTPSIVIDSSVSEYNSSLPVN